MTFIYDLMNIGKSGQLGTQSPRAGDSKFAQRAF